MLAEQAARTKLLDFALDIEKSEHEQLASLFNSLSSDMDKQHQLFSSRKLEYKRIIQKTESDLRRRQMKIVGDDEEFLHDVNDMLTSSNIENDSDPSQISLSNGVYDSHGLPVAVLLKRAKQLSLQQLELTEIMKQLDNSASSQLLLL